MLLIDSGSHTSLLRPSIAETYFTDDIKSSKSSLQTCTGYRETTHKVHANILSEYNIDIPLEFTLFAFHDYFDGIIGIRDLKKINLNIDITNQYLYNDITKIPLYFRDDFTLQKIDIPPLTKQKIIIKTDPPENFEGIWPAYDNGKVEIYDTLIKVKNGQFELEMNNYSTKTFFQTLDIETPRQIIEPFENNQYEIFNLK